MTIVSCLAGCVTLCLLLRGRSGTRGTTLTAPIHWAMASILAMVAAELAALVAPPSAALFARYTAAVLTLCPTLAVLGAKRPQNRGWQWVIAALVVTLWMPAAQNLLLAGGGEWLLFTPYRVLVFGLILLGLLNYLPTCHAAGAILFAASQVVGLGPFLGIGPATPHAMRVAISLLLSAGSALAVYVATARNGFERQAEPPQGSKNSSELTAHWKSFRNAYGAFWGIRIMQRVNQTAHVANLHIRLSWFGIESTADSDAGSKMNQEEAATLASSLRNVLQRFLRKE